MGISNNGEFLSLTALEHFVEKLKGKVPSPASEKPKMDGTATVGTETKYAREDHVHPQDSDLAEAIQILTNVIGSINQLNTSEKILVNAINEAYDRANPLNIYPVGSIYLSINSTNPSTLFGGTWERIQDTFLLAAGSTYAAGTIGGEATHKLTVGEIPSHTHKVLYHTSSGSQGFGYNYQAKGAWSDLASSSSGVSDVGGNGAHNNMPPYLAVYVWKRTK